MRTISKLADHSHYGGVRIRVADAAPTHAQRPMLFPDLASEAVRNDHHGEKTVGAAYFHRISHAIVSGRSSVGTLDDVILLGPGVVPDYVDTRINDGIAPPHTLTLPQRQRYLPGTSVLVTHWNSSIYGHWLIEGLPKLLVLRRMRGELPEFRVVVPNECATFVRAWADILLPDIEVDAYQEHKEHLFCERLLLPPDLSDGDHNFHPFFGELIDGLLQDLAIDTTPRDLVYTTRLEFNADRYLTTRTEIEAIARAAGFRMVAPESLPVREQIAVYASARAVVGEFGSAMHNAIFSPAGAKVLCINWVNAYQSRIGQLRGQDVGHLLDGTASGGIAYSINPGRREFAINPSVFKHCLCVL